MRRELLWAGIIGISFGLVIAFGAWRISSTNSGSAKIQSSPTPAPGAQEFKITLDKPENNDVVTQDTVTVSGITKSLAWLTVSGEQDDYIIQSGTDGVFSQDVNLIPGVNQIKVSAFDPAGDQSVEKILVVYSSSFQEKAVASPNPGDTSTESAIRAKVAEKVAEAINKPKAYVGVVTDIADSTIQIKTTDSQIKQVSISSDSVAVVNIKGTNNKIVKLTDIAIGDFIAAMGYVNSKSVLLAQRILITDPVEDPKISSTYGKVTGNTKKSISVASLKDNQTATVTPGVKTDVENYVSGKLTPVRLASIGIGDLVVYITDSSSDTPVVRTIFVIQKSS